MVITVSIRTRPASARVIIFVRRKMEEHNGDGTMDIAETVDSSRVVEFFHQIDLSDAKGLFVRSR